MKRILLAALLMFGGPMPAMAAPHSSPMSFKLDGNGGNCVGCGWISASGVITEDSVQRFQQFMSESKGKCHLVALDSPGGNLLAAMKLGRAFRKFGCTTIIGKAVPFNDGTRYANLEPGECYSACAYAFLGGKEREIYGEDRYGVHQHYLESAWTRPLESTLNALDMSLSQWLTGLLIAYAHEMGVDPLLVTVATGVSPGENIRILKQTELRELRVVTDIPPKREEWRLVPNNSMLEARIIQPQGEAKPVLTARVYCSAEPPDRLILEIGRPFKSKWEDQLKHELSYKGRKVILSLKPGQASYELPFEHEIVPAHDGLKQMNVRLAVSQKMFRDAEDLSWLIAVSRASQSFFGGWFSLDLLPSLIPFVQRECERS